MATGGDFSRSVENLGPDEVYDYTCTSCEKRNKTVKAVQYCTDCDIYYCQVCFEVHGGIPALQNHKVLGRNEVKNWGERKRSVSMPTEICSQHSGKTVEMFCENHDLLCCHICVSLKHRACEDIHFIPEVAEGIAQSRDFLRVNKNMERVMSDIEQIRNTRQQKKATLGKSRKDVLQNIKDYRKQVNRVLDTLEKKVTDDMEKLYRDNDMDIQYDIDACDNFTSKLKQMKQQLASTSATNESQTFINVKKCMQQINDGDRLIQTVYSSPRNDSLQFTRYTHLERFLTSLENPGKLEMRSTVPEVKKPKKDQPFKADNGRDYNVRIKEDKENCNIVGSCQMADGRILLTDSKNKKLKRLDALYKVTNHCDLPAGPRAVCCIGQQEAAVTDDSNNIHFVSVGSKMTVTRSIKMNHYVFGLAYSNNQLFVSDFGNTVYKVNTVYIYNMSGRCRRTLYMNNNGVAMFFGAGHIAVSPDGTKIYVADQDKGLVTLDSSGQLLSTFSDLQLSNPTGVCVHNDGSVFVCCVWSDYVIQVDEGGKQNIGVVATQTDGILRPWSVCIDKHKSTMMVTMHDQNTVRVFDFDLK